MSLEAYVLDIIEGRRSQPLVKALFSCLSRCYRVGVKWRHMAYDIGLFKTVAAAAPVVSVGNIVAGGTGKTPVVQMLVEALKGDQNIAILSRGFRSKAEMYDEEVFCVSRGQGPLLSPEICGDEPYCLAGKLAAQVWVGKDRVACAQEAVRHGAKCLILDDGMQHRRLKRDCEIVVIDANDPFGKGKFLPRGLLRDLPERLKKVDLIVANHIEDKLHYCEVQKMLAPFTLAPIVATKLCVLNSTECSNKTVGLFCGIGKPHYFQETVEELGNEIVHKWFLLDHIAPKKHELEAFVKESLERGAEVLLCTEKDWVKLPKDFRDRSERNFTVVEEKNGSDLEDFSAADISVHLCKEKSSRDESIFPSRTVKVIFVRSLTFNVLNYATKPVLLH